MRHVALLLCATAACGLARAADDPNKYEEQALTRCAQHRAERTAQLGRWERANTLRDLEAAFPGKLRKTEPGQNPDEGADWFALVAGARDEWRKADAVAAGLEPMYERWVQRLGLGPVPSIKKDEFLRFAQLIVGNAAAAVAQGDGAASTDADADKVFRVLDLDGDGELQGDELTSGLKEGKANPDADVNGRISKEEYREYFKRKVAAKADALVAKAGDPAARGPDGKPVGKAGAWLPEWFTTVDADKDGQLSLFEWRQRGKPVATFQEMDLNGDGLLTKDEYLRWAKMNEDALKQKKREEAKPPGGKPPPPGS